MTRDWIQVEDRHKCASVEEVIERLIQRGTAAERKAAPAQRYHNLDNLAGTWSAEDADAFRVATVDVARLDMALWR